MSVQFEWQVGSEDGQWEVLSRAGRGPRRKWPWWVWVILASALVVIAAGVYSVVRRRYRQAAQAVEFQIQGTIDLEARAFAQGDVELFLEQQDDAATSWYEGQALRAQPDCEEQVAGTEPRRSHCAPVLPATIASVDLRGDTAWVEVIEGEPPVRRARFYQQTDAGWKHTAPRTAFWGRLLRDERQGLTLLYHERDRPHVEPAVERIEEAAVDVCETIYCPVVSELTVTFSTEAPPYERPYLQSDEGHQGDDALTVSSPWLTGIPIDGAPDHRELVYWTAHTLATRAIRATTNQALNPLQGAVVTEYARWYATGDLSEAPILARIIEQNGEASLEDVFRSLRDEQSLDALLGTWLNTSFTDRPEAYLETLLDIERDALHAGVRETFLLLQDDRLPWWTEQQEQRFEQYQAYEPRPELPGIDIQELDAASGRAQATLTNASISDYHLPQNVVFRQRDKDWKHSALLSDTE